MHRSSSSTILIKSNFQVPSAGSRHIPLRANLTDTASKQQNQGGYIQHHLVIKTFGLSHIFLIVGKFAMPFSLNATTRTFIPSLVTTTHYRVTSSKPLKTEVVNTDTKFNETIGAICAHFLPYVGHISNSNHTNRQN